jgi:hypothetical protein
MLTRAAASGDVTPLVESPGRESQSGNHTVIRYKSGVVKVSTQGRLRNMSRHPDLQAKVPALGETWKHPPAQRLGPKNGTLWFSCSTY